MGALKKPFETLDQLYFDYLYYIKFCAKHIVECKRQEWVETLTTAGWTEKEWDLEFDRRYQDSL
jgi:hypothetical protein